MLQGPFNTQLDIAHRTRRSDRGPHAHSPDLAHHRLVRQRNTVDHGFRDGDTDNPRARACQRKSRERPHQSLGLSRTDQSIQPTPHALRDALVHVPTPRAIHPVAHRDPQASGNALKIVRPEKDTQPHRPTQVRADLAAGTKTLSRGKDLLHHRSLQRTGVSKTHFHVSTDFVENPQEKLRI